MAETIFENQDIVTFVLTGVLAGLSSLIVVARLVVKILKIRTLDKSDLLMVIAVIISNAYETLVASLLQQLRGKYPSQITGADALHIVTVVFQSQILGYLAPLFGRVSFCVYMLSTLTPNASYKRLVLIVFIVLQLVINISTVILICVRCGGDFPAIVEYYFLGEHRSCLASPIHNYVAVFAGSFNTLTDVYLTILPSLVLWNLKKMRRNTKIGIALMFGLSILACAASAGKTTMIKALGSHSDQIQRATHFVHFFWVSTTEMNTVTISASIPCLAPLFMGARSSLARRKSVVPLPLFETSCEGAPKRTLLRQKATSRIQDCFSFFRGPRVVKDLSDGELEDLIVARIRGAPMRIMVQKDVIIETEESGRGRILEGSSAIPLALRESRSGEGFAKTDSFGHDKATKSHTTTWEEFPTPQLAPISSTSTKSLEEYF
ncbi:hypothetical protein BDV97DRAFT_395665 [Delphinella strobiligena]|nr:hypothetical protein BDV97DRAFT_395665 [Delphinella strobiligena]